MFEVLIFAAGVATGLLLLALPYHRAASDRDVLQAAKDSLARDVEALTNRVKALRGDNIALEAANKLNGETITELTQQRDDLKREIGRMEAERRAAQPKRDKTTGRFLPSPKAAPKKPKPVACG